MKVRSFLITMLTVLLLVSGWNLQISASTGTSLTSQKQQVQVAKKNKLAKQELRQKRKVRQMQVISKPAKETRKQQAENRTLTTDKETVNYNVFWPHGYTYFFATTPNADTSIRGDFTMSSHSNTTPSEYRVEYKTRIKTSKVKRFFAKTGVVLLYVPKKIGQGFTYIGKGAKRLLWR